jgi:hypothetical protein
VATADLLRKEQSGLRLRRVSIDCPCGNAELTGGDAQQELFAYIAELNEDARQRHRVQALSLAGAAQLRFGKDAHFDKCAPEIGAVTRGLFGRGLLTAPHR